MKVFTTTKKKVFDPNYGWLEVPEFRFFGFRYGRGRIHKASIEILENKTSTHDLEEMAMYLEWRNKMHLPYIENSEFDLTLNEKI